MYSKTFKKAVTATFILLMCLTVQLAFGQTKPQSVQLAPDFTFNSLSGESFAFPAARSDKPTLLYFWATWCPYCKIATPKVVALHRNYGNVINVLAVNVGINDSVSQTKLYIDEFNIEFPVSFDHDNSISQSYGVLGTPVFVIISQTGQLLYRGHRYPDGIEQALAH